MHITSTNVAWKHEYDVKLWRHKQRTPNRNEYHMPLNDTPPWKFSAYATGLGSGKTLSELHIHYKSLATRVYYHAGCTEYCKNFTVALKLTDVVDKKQMHDSVFTRKEYASKYWTYVISMFFLTSFNVYFVCGCACFMCICLKTAIWLFLVKTGWQPCYVV